MLQYLHVRDIHGPSSQAICALCCCEYVAQVVPSGEWSRNFVADVTTVSPWLTALHRSTASVNGRTGVLGYTPENLTMNTYEYAQNKMAGVHIRRKIISQRTVWRPLCIRPTFIMICVLIWSIKFSRHYSS